MGEDHVILSSEHKMWTTNSLFKFPLQSIVLGPQQSQRPSLNSSSNPLAPVNSTVVGMMVMDRFFSQKIHVPGSALLERRFFFAEKTKAGKVGSQIS